MGDNLKVCLVASEIAPIAKTGGLGDFAYSLSRELSNRGCDIRPFIPFYSSICAATNEFVPVDKVQNIPLQFGSKSFQFSVFQTELPNSDAYIYLIHCPALFHRSTIYSSAVDEHLRFALLSRAAIKTCAKLDWIPEVFHCNDWHTALIPLYVHALRASNNTFIKSNTLLTIHNIGYQGNFGAGVLPELGLAAQMGKFDDNDLSRDRINFLKTGIMHADAISTVSPTYADELCSPEFGEGLSPYLVSRRESFFGILNGVDYSEWGPESDPHIPFNYSKKNRSGKKGNRRALLKKLGLKQSETAMVIGVVTRLSSQKGIDLLQECLPTILLSQNVRLIVLGSGEERYEEFFTWLMSQYPGKVVFYRGFHNELAHLIEAGSDVFLMPSRYEPCGLNQIYSLRYGTIPIVRNTGGLADTVDDFDPISMLGNGFVFENYVASELRSAIHRALDAYSKTNLWGAIVDNAMDEDYSWRKQAPQYLALYESLPALAK